MRLIRGKAALHSQVAGMLASAGADVEAAGGIRGPPVTKSNVFVYLLKVLEGGGASAGGAI